MKDDFLNNDNDSYKVLGVVLSIVVLIFAGFLGMAIWLMSAAK